MRARGMLMAAMAALIVAAATLSVPAAAQDEGASSGGESVLRIGWSQDPKTLNPFIGVNEEEFTIWAINWELLVGFSPEDLSPAPAIAESWDVSEDGRTVHLPPDRGRDVVRRRADHLRGRQVLARDPR